MKRINKTLIRHIPLVFLFSILTVFIWFLLVYCFLNIRVKSEVFPILEDSKSLLSEVVNKKFDIYRVKRFVRELEKNEYIQHVDIKIEGERIISNKIDSLLISVLKFSYPIKNDKKTIGRVEIWPSYKFFDDFLSDKNNLTVFFMLVVLLVFFFVFMFFWYIKRYIIMPFNQINTMVNKIYLNEKINLSKFVGQSIWKDVFLSIKNLNNKVFDINTTMKLLFSATSIIGSDLEFINSIQLIFDVIKKRIPSSRCTIFIYDKNDQLKAVAKNGFFNNNVAFIPKGVKNYIWECYEKSSDKIINDVSEVDKDMLGGLYNDGDNGSFAIVPLINENLSKSIGVLVIITNLKNSFDYDSIDIIKVVSSYLTALINRTNHYQKIKDRNRRLELESQFASKELLSKNEMLIKRIKNTNVVFDILKYTTECSGIKDAIVYIMYKVRELFSVEKAGLFIYDKDKKELTSISNSFGLKKDLKIQNKKGTVYNEVLTSGKTLILNSGYEIDKYTKTSLQDDVEIKSAVLIPIRAKNNEISAIFVLLNKTDDEFTVFDVRFLEYISVIISGIMKR